MIIYSTIVVHQDKMKLKISCKLIKKYELNLSKFLTKFNIECLTCKRIRNRFFNIIHNQNVRICK